METIFNLWEYAIIPIVTGTIVYAILSTLIKNEADGKIVGIVGGVVVGAIVSFFVFSSSEVKPVLDDTISYFDDIEVVDRQVEEKTRKDNVLGEEEAIEAIFNQYPKGSVVKGYRLGNPTGYGGVSRHESYNTRNKRDFTVGYNLDNGRIGYLEGVVTKTNGVIRVKVDKVILE